MGMNNMGLMNGNRPDQPRGGNYEAPHINVHLLRHQGLYSEAAPDLELPLALHHVIPWEFLWHFWNALIGQQYYDTARDFLSVYGFHKAQTESWISNMEARRFIDPTVGRIEQRLCWAEWNLVRGPAHRTTAESEGTTNPASTPARTWMTCRGVPLRTTPIGSGSSWISAGS